MDKKFDHHDESSGQKMFCSGISGLFYRNEQESHRVDCTFACALRVEQFQVSPGKCVLKTGNNYTYSNDEVESRMVGCASTRYGAIPRKLIYFPLRFWGKHENPQWGYVVVYDIRHPVIWSVDVNILDKYTASDVRVEARKVKTQSSNTKRLLITWNK